MAHLAIKWSCAYTLSDVKFGAFILVTHVALKVLC